MILIVKRGLYRLFKNNLIISDHNRIAKKLSPKAVNSVYKVP